MQNTVLDEISYLTRGAIFAVYNYFGPGLLENIYERALLMELKARGLSAQSQVPVNVSYMNEDLGLGYKLDVLVEEQIIIELKSVECLLPCHYKQLQTYLNLSGLSLGFLVISTQMIFKPILDALSVNTSIKQNMWILNKSVKSVKSVFQ